MRVLRFDSVFDVQRSRRVNGKLLIHSVYVRFALLYVSLMNCVQEVASEFTAGVQSSAKEYNKELVGGLQGANALVGDARSGVKDLKKMLAPAKDTATPPPESKKS